MERTNAILVRKTAWSETSLIVTWLTEHFGAIRTMARGARRTNGPFFGKLDLFHRMEILFAPAARGDLHTLREVGAAIPFDAARAGSKGYVLAAYCDELAEHSAPSMQSAIPNFDLLCRALAYIQQGRADEAALHHFERELCRILGVGDVKGAVDSASALGSLLGSLPRSRNQALRFLRLRPEAKFRSRPSPGGP